MFKERRVWHNSQTQNQLNPTFIRHTHQAFLFCALPFIVSALTTGFQSLFLLRHYITGIKESEPFEAPSAHKKTHSPGY